jgi:hypothetical protein
MGSTHCTSNTVIQHTASSSVHHDDQVGKLKDAQNNTEQLGVSVQPTANRRGSSTVQRNASSRTGMITALTKNDHQAIGSSLSHPTNLVPTTGKALAKLVITVLPQRDICPHGNTYPINAVKIITYKITTLTSHTNSLTARYVQGTAVEYTAAGYQIAC